MSNRKLMVPGMIAAIVFLVALYALGQNISAINYSKFSINGNTFPLSYVATTEIGREQGLMNKTITNSTTMLFVFPAPGIYPFWMFDTYTDLDMIWINGSPTSGKIVYIAANATSCFDENYCAVYNPNKFANYVIEAKAGFVKRNAISIGEVVNLS